MAEPPNLVLQVNVSRFTFHVCVCVCVCVRREPGNEASIQLYSHTPSRHCST